MHNGYRSLGVQGSILIVKFFIFRSWAFFAHDLGQVRDPLRKVNNPI
jgi:hypothetical protein